KLPDPPATVSYASILPAALSVSNTPTPTLVLTPTLLPASVTVPTKTSLPTVTPTLPPTATPISMATATVRVTESAADHEINKGIQMGNQIVKAIEAYHTDMGFYPSDLTALMPHYLSIVPITEAGRPFFYRLFDAASPMAPEVYWLAFRIDSMSHVTCTYMRRLDYWDCNYLSP
ncbi:MAG TPA: hypothetical protein VHM28_11690, partial [Anaerolineales bacterium]|nr:hypothetical protein [Anaerolineales bacterium]